MKLKTCLAFLAFMAATSQAATLGKPNIIVILADDVGYGDLGCYGATKIKTPNLDRLAAQGLRCTDAYAPAAVCTPTRYAMLTGRWAWRQPGTDILPGEAPLCIQPGTVTLPSLLRDAGYATAVVGKWHLGLGTGRTDYNHDLKPGPLEIGFDHAFIFPATNDRVPTLFIKDHQVVNYDPTDPIQIDYRRKLGSAPDGYSGDEFVRLKVKQNPDHHRGTIINGVSRIGWMTGGRATCWKDEELSDVLTSRAVEFIEHNKGRPFFLYFATHTVHEPHLPAKRFQGASQCGVYGDFIQELDWAVGEVLQALDRLGLAKDTLVIFSSDNGAGLTPTESYLYDDAGRDPLSHPRNGVLRGAKADQWEGGTRVPLIARWPGKIKPGRVSSEIISLVDLSATCAAILNRPLPAKAAPDSVNILPALLGEGPGRDFVIEQHCRGNGNLAIRKRQWKLIPTGNGAQLFNLADDIGETKDVAAQHPDLVEKLSTLLKQVREQEPEQQSKPIRQKGTIRKHIP
jgi:arylsulfatase A-like enzyme